MVRAALAAPAEALVVPEALAVPGGLEEPAALEGPEGPEELPRARADSAALLVPSA